MGNIVITPSIPIILASASKIRQEILRKTGLEFSVIISEHFFTLVPNFPKILPASI